MEDLESVTEIDFQLLGKRRRDYWETRLERSAFSGVPSLAAQIDGEVGGFVLGTVSGWEYGIPESVAWIDTIGVLKEYQSKGVARLLMNEMTAMFKKVGISTVYTFVNWRDLDLLQFLPVDVAGLLPPGGSPPEFLDQLFAGLLGLLPGLARGLDRLTGRYGEFFVDRRAAGAGANDAQKQQHSQGASDDPHAGRISHQGPLSCRPRNWTSCRSTWPMRISRASRITSTRATAALHSQASKVNSTARQTTDAGAEKAARGRDATFPTIQAVAIRLPICASNSRRPRDPRIGGRSATLVMVSDTAGRRQVPGNRDGGAAGPEFGSYVAGWPWAFGPRKPMKIRGAGGRRRGARTHACRVATGGDARRRTSDSTGVRRASR